jgi:hypothetical protein
MTTLPSLFTPCTWKYVLGEINADGTNLHVDDPFGDSLFNDHPLALSMSGAGVVH